MSATLIIRGYKEAGEEDFNIGDRVKYTSGCFFDTLHSPLWGGKHGYIKGVVVDDDSHDTPLPIKVEWDNGRFNYYCPDDLEYCIDLPESLFEL